MGKSAEDCDGDENDNWDSNAKVLAHFASPRAALKPHTRTPLYRSHSANASAGLII